MKLIAFQIPTIPTTWPEPLANWEHMWRLIDAELKASPLVEAKVYFAENEVEVWVWCHGKDTAGEVQYWVWCFTPYPQETLSEELLPMKGKDSRIWSCHLRVSIDLAHFSTLHVGGFDGEKDKHLKGKVLRGRDLPVMDF
jgi:hypothetical protein